MISISNIESAVEKAREIALKQAWPTSLDMVRTVLETGLMDGLVMPREGGQQFVKVDGRDAVMLNADGVELKRVTPTEAQWDALAIGYALYVAGQPKING